jgi:phage terminase Nu1 subunit (DNA packaging protein)
MAENQISEKEVDSIILELIKLHSADVRFDEKSFMDLLKYSLSLNTMEKKRVVDSVPTLSQFQFDELTKVFTEERDKFKDLAKQHPDDIKKLVAKQKSEWLDLGDLYKAETEDKLKQNEDQDKIDDIKA